jgi:hypothetical protein
MLKKTAFIEYKAGNRYSYWLSFVYERRRNRVLIHSAEIYSKDGKFLGTWLPENMPLNQLLEWRQLIKQWYPDTTTEEVDTTWLI